MRQVQVDEDHRGCVAARRHHLVCRPDLLEHGLLGSHGPAPSFVDQTAAAGDVSFWSAPRRREDSMRLITSRKARTPGLDDVGADARTAIAAAVMVDVDDGLALGVLALGDAAQLELAQRRMHAGAFLDGLECRVDRAVAARPCSARRGRRRGAARRRRGPARRAEPLRRSRPAPRAVLVAALGAQHQRLDVAVEEFLLLVGQRLEIVEDAGEFGVGQLESEFLDALAQGRAAAVLAEHEVRARHADVVRSHDLVGRVMLQHAVLVDARLVREGVLADHRLVARNRHAGDAREQAARREQALGVDAGVQAVDAFTRLQRHHDFLERAVARALADAVDRAFDLPRAATHGHQAVGHGQTEVVVAMHRERHAPDATHVLAQVAEQLGELVRHRVADRVGMLTVVAPASITASTTSARNSRFGARGVLGRELDVVAELARDLHALDGAADDLVLRHVELVLAMDRAGGEEHVDAVPLRILQRASGRELDVVAVAAREAADDRALRSRARSALTASQSPREAAGKPASMTSTPRSASARATRSFSGCVMLQPGDCSPSRSVVSKIRTRSGLSGHGRHRGAPGQATHGAADQPVPGRARACARAACSRPSRSGG